MTAADEPAASQYLYGFFPNNRPELANDPDAWTKADEVVIERHHAYLERATAAGTVLLAGRSQDGVGPAIVIFRAVSEEEARSFMENDPFVREGLFRAALHPFRAAFVGDP